MSLLVPELHELDPRRRAPLMYWLGFAVPEISQIIGLPEGTLRQWKSRDDWDGAPVLKRIEAATEAKYIQLVLKEPKSGRDLRDIDALGRQLERMARIRRYEQPGGHEGDLRPAIENRNAGPKRKPVRNAFTDEQIAQLKANFEERLFGYQRLWWANRERRSRGILKSRQIGATWYFAFEALIDALEEGRNKVFLSASKNQAHVFRNYIISYAKEVGVDLVGDPIDLACGAQLIFLGTNFRTAQSYHGDLYFDEFFWVFGFKELQKVASGMAMHKHWRLTYFSTPSSITHQAYGFWNGDEWNRKLERQERREFDVSWAALKDGAVGPDGMWRHIVTVEDAQRLGCDLFDIPELRRQYSTDQFANLLMCEFIDDALSVFPLSELQRCIVAAPDVWEDVDFSAMWLKGRPYGNRPVWLGYDPAATGDSAALVIVAPPQTRGGKFRCLEKFLWKGLDFTAQAQAIRDVCRRYNVVQIGIDATGIGLAVHQLVRQFFPAAREILYSPDVKMRLVLKAKDVVASKRIEIPDDWTDLVQAMVSVRKGLTASGRQATYDAPRDAIGHADLFWALSHALDFEPLEAAVEGMHRASTVEIFE